MKRRGKFGLVSGDRVSPKASHVSASATAPFAPDVFEVTRAVGALLRIRSVEGAKVRAAPKRKLQAASATKGGGHAGRRCCDTAARTGRRSECRGSPGRPQQAGKTGGDAEWGRKDEEAPLDEGRNKERESAQGQTSRLSNAKIIQTRFGPPGFTKFDQLPSRPNEFTEVEAGALRRTREGYDVRADVTAAHSALTLVGDRTKCALVVNYGPKSRRLRWLREARRRVALGEAPSLRFALKVFWGKWDRQGYKVIPWLKPKMAPALGTYSKIF